MLITNTVSDPRVSEALTSANLVVLRTDTIYGIVASATNCHAMERLYRAKHRPTNESCIILVANISDIPGLTPPQRQHYLQLNAERPTSIIVPASNSFLHTTHQNGTLAFRLVTGNLARLIHQTGPLLAPSANPAGMPPAKNITEAIKYFGDMVSVYIDGGEVTSTVASRIIKLQADDIVTIRT